MSNHPENKKVRFQEDFVEMKTSPTTSSAEFPEISRISERIVSSQTECKFYFFMLYFAFKRTKLGIKF